MKKVIVGMALAGLLTMGCGTSEKGETIDEDISFETAEMAIEDISPEDLSEETIGLYSSPPDLSPMSDSSGKGILLHLNPNKALKGCRVPILRVIEGPIHIEKFLTLTSPSCAEVVTEGNCPVLKTGDVCTRRFSMNCPVEVSLPVGISDVLTFTGSLTQSVEIKGINEFAETVTAVNLKVSSQNTGAYLLYNGSVSADITKTIDGHKLVFSAQNLHIENSSGTEGSVSGTRVVEVIKDKSIKITNSGTIRQISPEGRKEITIEVQMSKEISIDGDVKTITLSDSIITNGVERTREGTITIAKEINEGDLLKEIVIDGEETITGPKGTFYVTIDNLVLDLNCSRNPRGGTITVSNGEKEIKIVFKDSCSCDATLILPDGTEKQIDSCYLRRNLCR